MHASRPVRALKTGKLLQHSARILIEATTTDTTFRSRATEIKMNVLYEMLQRDKILNDLRKFILTQYASRMKTQFKTLSAQKAFIEVLLAPYTEVSKDMSFLIQIADLIIADIDQAGWGLKRIEETLTNLVKEKYG